MRIRVLRDMHFHVPGEPPGSNETCEAGTECEAMDRAAGAALYRSMYCMGHRELAPDEVIFDWHGLKRIGKLGVDCVRCDADRTALPTRDEVQSAGPALPPWATVKQRSAS